MKKKKIKKLERKLDKIEYYLYHSELEPVIIYEDNIDPHSLSDVFNSPLQNYIVKGYYLSAIYLYYVTY